jgi:hypothetical protein
MLRSYNVPLVCQFRGEILLKELAICLLLSVACLGQSARRYYNELYKAGGLDRMADEYVCFDDDDKLETFFIFGESKTISNQE